MSQEIIIFVGQSVNVEKRITESWQSKQWLKNAIVKEIFPDKVWVVADQESTHSEWCDFCSGGHFYNFAFEITPLN